MVKNTKKTNNETVTEEFVIDSSRLVEKVTEIIKEGQTRKIIIKNHQNEEILAIPLTWGVASVVLAPLLVAVGAIAAVATKSKVIVEKKVENTKKEKTEGKKK